LDSVPLFLALGINAFGAGMFFPFAIIYYQAVTSLPVASIGLALTSATLITLSVNPVTGVLVDRFGARRLVVLSHCLEATGFAAYLAVSSALSLFAAALLATAGARMFFASSSTLIAEMAAGADRDRWYGLVGITQSIGASLSGVLASLLIGSTGVNGFRVIIAVNVGCLLISAALIHRSRSARPHQRTGSESIGYRTILRDKVFLTVIGGNLLFVLASMLMGIGSAVYVTEALDAPLWSVGVIGAAQTVLVIGCQTRVSNRMSGVRRTRTMGLAGAIWIVAYLGFAAGGLIPRPLIVPYLFIVAITFTIAQLFYMPASRALAAGMGPTEARGRYIATYELSWGLAAAISPAMFGIVYGLAPHAPWLVMAVGVAVAVCLLRIAEPGIPPWQNRPGASHRR
ncbi:MAG: MFS transporter, partial [Chloroflexota bacterium]|nr:MFS transporter [Chloroflexota bacterium]